MARRPGTVPSPRKEELIGSRTLHPVRSLAIVLLALPATTAVAAGGAAAFAQVAVAHALLRLLEYTLAVESLFIVLAAAVGAIYQAVASARDRRENPPPGRLIDIGGVRLHLVCQGEGSPTVVLEYGLVGSWLDWSAVQPEIARFTRVCAYDRAGYGWSDPSPERRTCLNAARELRTLLVNAGIKPPYVLVGHSMGGHNARVYARTFAEDVAGMVLLDASHPDQGDHSWQERLWIKFLRFTAPLGLPRWRGWCSNGPPATRGMRRAFECRSQFYKTYDAHLGCYRESVEQVRRAGLLGDMPLVVVARDPQRSSRVDQQREARHRTWQQDLSRLSSRGRLVIAQNSGHAIMRDRADVVVDAIRTIVEAVREQQAQARPEPPVPLQD